MTIDATHCRAVATPVGDDVYFLRIELGNSGPEPIDVSTYEPFTAFSIVGTADGKPVTVHEPALDIPINPVTLHVPPGGTVTLETPIRLRIAEGAEPGSDGFVWTIPHGKESVSLDLKLALPAPIDASCRVTFA